MPWEKQLIDALGLTLEEYQWYANQVANHRPERDAAYDHVPHVVCDPTGGILTAVVGIGLSFAAQALAPKPKLPKRSDPAQQQRGADVTGASVSADNRFSNVDGFTSVQPLARLGEVMPLVFVNRQAIGTKTYGGVRVETKLLWSQLLSQGDGQELLAIFLAGAGVLAEIPSIKGFAIGDSLIRGYQENKFAVYFKRGVGGEGRLTTSNLVAGQLAARGADVFLADFSTAGMQALFSGVRIPTTMTQFGISEPLRNAQSWRLPYKRVRVSKPPFVNPGPGGDVAAALREWQKETDAATKADVERNKVQSSYSCRTGINKINGAFHANSWQDVDVPVGAIIEFAMYGGNISNTFGEFGVQDIAAKDDNYRISCDEVLIPGETYLIHEVEAVCTGSNPASTIWSPTVPKAYFFKALTAGKVRRVSEQIIVHEPDFNSRNLGAYINPCNGATLLKLAVANITTTRRLNQVEIGIKSQVWKRFTGISNFSSQPSETTLAAIEAGGNNYIVGQYSEYGLRYSFFRLQIREKGTEAWITLEDSAGPFCVRGRTPVDQFNFIRIKFPRDDVQYEIRLRPLAGGSILNESTGIKTRVLDARSGDVKKYGVFINNGGFEISYKGSTEIITQSMGTNSVMFFGGKAETGAVQSLGAVDYITNGEQELATFATTTVSGPGSGLTVSVVATETSSTVKYTAIAKAGADSFSMKWLHNLIGAVTPTDLGERFKGRALYSYAPPGVDPNPNIQIEVELDLTSAKTTAFGVQQGYAPGDKSFMWSCSAVPGARITLTGFTRGTPISGQYALKKPVGVAMPPSNFEYSLLDLTTSEDVTYIASVIPVGRGSGYAEGSKVKVQGIGINLGQLTVQELVVDGQSVAENYDAVADVYLYDQQEGSHQNGPEHQVVYVNEQRQNETTPIYDNMALVGLQLRSGKEWNDFNNFTYYAKQGINVTRMVEPTSGNTSGYSPTSSTTGPTHLFPEILRHLLRAPSAGAGTLIPEDMIDWPGFQAACKVCIQNNLFYDGVIGSPVNVRDWAYEHAPYFFLDFLILGGKISLQPTFPVAPEQGLTGYSIYGAYARLPKISALFTDGNIVEDSLQVSWYPTEQRLAPQVLITVRDEVEDGFAETRNILVRPNDPNHRSLQVEAVDFTGFCTNATHAVSFAKLLIQTRRYVTHTITFKTFPEGLALAPGAYFKVASQARHVDQFQNGYVLNDGKVVSSTGLSDSNSVYWWRSGLTEVQTGTMTVDGNGFTSATFAGAVFTVYSSAQSAYVYKAELISYDEEGMVEISGTHVPVDATGRITYLNLADDQFVVENEQ